MDTDADKEAKEEGSSLRSKASSHRDDKVPTKKKFRLEDAVEEILSARDNLTAEQYAQDKKRNEDHRMMEAELQKKREEERRERENRRDESRIKREEERAKFQKELMEITQRQAKLDEEFMRAQISLMAALAKQLNPAPESKTSTRK